MSDVWLMNYQTGDYYVTEQLVGVFTSIEQAKKAISEKDLLSRWEERTSQAGELWIEGSFIVEGYGEVGFELILVPLNQIYGLQWERKHGSEKQNRYQR